KAVLRSRSLSASMFSVGRVEETGFSTYQSSVITSGIAPKGRLTRSELARVHGGARWWRSSWACPEAPLALGQLSLRSRPLPLLSTSWFGSHEGLQSNGTK